LGEGVARVVDVLARLMKLGSFEADGFAGAIKVGEVAGTA
jgi:hypothetical protein